MQCTRAFTYCLLNVAPDLVAPANVTAALGVERLAERGIEVRVPRGDEPPPTPASPSPPLGTDS